MIFTQSRLSLKCPYCRLRKVHILVLGVPNNRLTCMQGQKTLSFSYNMHLFLPYLLNDSQTIRSTINFSKPFLCLTLICSDWSDAVFVRQCCFVYSVTGETAIFNPPKVHLVAKNEFAFSFRPTRKSSFQAGNMLKFHVDVNLLTRFNDSESTLSFERQ